MLRHLAALVVVLAVSLIPAEAATPPTDIAVVDTGVQCAHEALLGKCLQGFFAPQFLSDMDDSTMGHGTSMAHLASSTGARVLPVKVCKYNGQCADVAGEDVDGVAAGIRWAADSGVRIITASVYSLLYSQTIQDAVDYAGSKGVVVISIAGNTGLLSPTPDPETVYPLGARTGMIVVGGSDGAGVWSGSTLSSYVDILAPARARAAGCAPAPGFAYQQPCSVVWDGSAFGGTGPVYWTTTGTSMAAPVVAATVHSMLVANPALTVAQVEAILKETATPVAGSAAGIMDSTAAVQRASELVATSESPHWPRLGPDVTIPVLVYNFDSSWRTQSYDAVAQAAEQWSASSRVNLQVVGEIPNPAEVCQLQDGAYNRGYISVCMGVPTAGTATSMLRWCPPLDDGECWSEHFRAGKVVAGSPLPKTHHIVHELGHALGLYHESGGVMTASGTVTSISAGNFADLEALMVHDDGFETVATFTQPTPSPTPSPSPSPTPTASPTATPPPSPTPCSPPRARRCR